MSTQNRRPPDDQAFPLQKADGKDRSAGIQRDNLLLAMLPTDERARLQPFSELVHIDVDVTVITPDEPIANIYFPISLVTSTIQEFADGSVVESGLMGAEGMVGIQFWLHQSRTPSRTLIQVPGMALRMPSDVFKREVMDKSSPLNPLIARYIHAFLTMTGRTAACNRLHEVETRLARWLSLIYDRVGSEFAMRQEFLAAMLGVRRPAVSIAAGTLQKAGLISYRRGRMIVEDPLRLRAASCECYAMIEEQFDKLYGSDWRTSKQLPNA